MESPRPSHEHEIVLLEERSAGTFARVYLAEARSPEIKRLVAVKVLREQWAETPDILLRTRDEAALLARLRHRSILRVESLAVVEGQPAIVMEFVDGLDLGMLMERHAQPFPRRAVYRIALDIASALDAAYCKVPYGMEAPLRVVHRDIKPSNVMISVEGEVKVLDFGTARFASESRLAETGALRFGSLKYMSPERREGDRGDHSADVYSLGLMVIELFMGQPQPLLPLDHGEHDRHVATRIARLGALGLPNGDWEDSLRQTLAAMCSSAPEARLSAAQVSELMRAFADQASGASLESFATETVEPLARKAHPQTQSPSGGLSGSRVFVAVNPPESALARPLVESKQTLIPEGLPTPPTRGLAQVPPTRTEHATTTTSPTAAKGKLAPLARPPVDAQVMPAGDLRSSAETGRHHNKQFDRHDTERTPTPAPGAAKRGMGAYIAAAIVVAVLLFLGVVVVSGAIGLWYYTRPPPPTVDPVAPPATPAAVAATANAVKIEISATDETIQWVRLVDAAGNRIVNASPQASGQVEPGTYEIVGKLVARPEQRAAIVVADEDFSLQCGHTEKSRIVCTTNQDQTIELAP